MTFLTCRLDFTRLIAFIILSQTQSTNRLTAACIYNLQTALTLSALSASIYKDQSIYHFTICFSAIQRQQSASFVVELN